MGEDPNNALKTAQECFDTSAFVECTPGHCGKSRRAAGIANFDFLLFRNSDTTENQRLQFRAEAFNLFNTSQFDPPSTMFGTAAFGKIFSAGDGRQLQLA
jgi:hypothetical protein